MGITVEWLGRVPYGEAWELQRRVFDDVVTGAGPNRLLLCEHPDVLTLGRNARTDQNLRTNREALEAAGYEIYDVDRGGDVTYHGPGQLVGYPIVRLADYREDLGWYMRSLEGLVIMMIADDGLRGGRKEGMTGVWISDRKICAIGVRASRWTTMHGFALNVTTDLARFEAIVPCGIRDFDVTSVQRETGRVVTLEDMARRAEAYWDRAMDPS